MSTTATATPSTHALSPPLPSSNAHRRIALQSPLDLLYLRNNALRAARAKIDLHLPPDAAASGTAGEGDTMRRTVEREVAAFVDKVFDGVKRGSEINGISGEEVVLIGDNAGGEEYEPLDTRLAEKISNLHAQIEAMNMELAETRRTAAKRAAQEFEAEFQKQRQEIDEACAKQEGAAVAVSRGELNINPGSVFHGRDEEVQQTWSTALKNLADVQAKLGETRERAEKARQVADYMKS